MSRYFMAISGWYIRDKGSGGILCKDVKKLPIYGSKEFIPKAFSFPVLLPLVYLH